MLEKHALSDLTITKYLKKNYGIEAATLTFLPIGADINASMYKVQAFDQTPYFIKIKQGHNHDLSVEIVELLHRADIQQIIPPIKTIHGKATQSIDDFTLIVYPFVDGQDGFNQNLIPFVRNNDTKAQETFEAKVHLEIDPNFCKLAR